MLLPSTRPQSNTVQALCSPVVQSRSKLKGVPAQEPETTKTTNSFSLVHPDPPFFTKLVRSLLSRKAGRDPCPRALSFRAAAQVILLEAGVSHSVRGKLKSCSSTRLNQGIALLRLTPLQSVEAGCILQCGRCAMPILS